MEEVIGQDMWKRVRASRPSLSAPLSPDLHVLTRPDALNPLLWEGFLTQV